MKFGRTYSITAQGKSGTFHTFGFPLTCQFTIQNTNLSSCGAAVLQVFNLSRDVRDDLYADIFAFASYRQIVVAAGYVGNGSGGTNPAPNSKTKIGVIFQGSIYQCYSYRAGPDWITEFKCLDGITAIENTTINIPLPAKYSFDYAINKLCEALAPTVKLGVIGNVNPFVNTNPRGFVMAGGVWELLTQLTQAQQILAFIYQEKVYVVKDYEYLEDDGSIPEISADTGMIGSPKLQEQQVSVSMIFEPAIHPIRKVELKTAENRMNGPYNVQQVIHRGTISGSECGTLTTEVVMYKPNTELQAVFQ